MMQREGNDNMKNIWHIIQAVVAAAGAGLGWFLGGLDGLLIALIAFAMMDYVTGVCCAIADHTLSSMIGFRGILKKVLMFVLVGAANLIDVYLIKTGEPLRTAVIFFFISNEGISLLENAARLGLPIPSKLKNILQILHDKAEEQDKDKEETPDDDNVPPGDE